MSKRHKIFQKCPECGLQLWKKVNRRGKLLCKNCNLFIDDPEMALIQQDVREWNKNKILRI